jgi:lipopolysaccharide export system protein LptC
MTAEAARERQIKQTWATPGSAHDRLIRWSKVVLPSAVGAVVAILAFAPLEKKGDVSFILDKKKVESAQERMRTEQARYVGSDNKGQQFVVTANNALQRSSDVPIVDIHGMHAQIAQPQGPLNMTANQARYNLDTQRMAVDGPVQVAGGDGYHLATSNVLVDLKDQQLESQGPVSGQMRLGQFEAKQMKADLRARTVVLEGGGRLKIVQGAVR